MSATPLVLTSPSHAGKIGASANNSSLVVTLAMIASDFLTLSVMFGIAVICRHFLTPRYSLMAYFELVPMMLMVVGAFWIQGLYPAVLLHPAEEMRRITVSVTTVFLVMSCSAVFMEKRHRLFALGVSNHLGCWIAASVVITLLRAPLLQAF